MPPPSHHATPHDALIKALEHVEEIEGVLIIYSGKEDGKAGSFDSDLTIADSLYLIELFKFWLMRAVLGDLD